ncbi:M55 family metallopeptidase (plasmid) [Alicyclobacillus fastidiosus]|uniref:M55 family metallopeptidase n=1 Tax=Alicyclobacillus fastidiosus TaxID=392011 RepID=A0ABY6ZPS6_9BACL|nr:M55 family metallopeptidase [Alicyclobacillus fastidiosus]WAH44852.1 M55 family metallopeptidase [Alicyclobacillus fastidiosus]GMA65821.1 transporter [Alicyclobacillus fastidiosus]GMA65893.1 transporter [Alicyclobacillus fastidiosus]
MKLFISADIEGVSGVATNVQLTKEPEYQRFRKLMTQEVNAAIEGAFEGGATEVVVADGHGNMSNILIEDLDERARLISGSNRVMCQLEGLDSSFDGIFFVGHHGREGGSERSIINHSLAGICVSEVKVNGVVCGETEINARVAGQFGVPSLLITGDDAYVAEVKETLPNVEAAIVKRGIDRFAAELLAPKRAHALIREKARIAVERAKEFEPLVIEGPITFEVEFKGTSQALMTTTIPVVEMVGPKKIRFTCPDMVTAYKLFWGCVIIAMTATNGVLSHANA